VTGDAFRALALALDGAEERAHMGHPDFRVNGRIFASLMADERRAMVKITPDEQAALIAQAPGAFGPAAGAWGRQGSTMVDLAAADPAVVRGALVLAWELASAQPPARPRAPRHAGRT
jgi:hypothetical protein